MERIGEEKIETLHETRYLTLYDLQYAPGKHYFEASRRKKDSLVASMEAKEAREMLPDAVTVAVVLRLPDGDTRLVMFYEYRYPVGRFLLSPVAGLVDEKDREGGDPLVRTAVREIREEIGLTVKDTDQVTVLNECTFCTPGITDESNAFLLAEISVPDLSGLNHRGTEGAELLTGFELLTRERAEEIYRRGRDDYGNFYSLATWTVLRIFLDRF